MGTPMTTPTAASRLGANGARLRERAGRFLPWWRESLRQWVPRTWRQHLGLGGDRLLMSLEGDALDLAWDRHDEVLPLARVPAAVELILPEALLGRRLASFPRWLVLPPDTALRRPLRLPAAASDRLRDVVAFEVDRQTPFPAAAVHFDARVLERREDGRVDVELVVVPRQVVNQALARLGPLAGNLAGVDLFDAAGQPLRINLLPPQDRTWRGGRVRRLHLVLGLVALAATIAGAARILDNRRDAAEALEARVRSNAEAARRVSAQRQQLDDLVQGGAFLARERAARPPTLQVLDELSRRLPDGTYLEKVSVEGNRLMLIGLSSEAASLVGRLEGAPLWRNPALSGALQPDPRVRRDRFSLTAELVPQAGAAAPPAAMAGGR